MAVVVINGTIIQPAPADSDVLIVNGTPILWEVAAGVSLEGCLFRSDNGNESAASSIGNNSANLSSGDKVRLRFLVNAIGNPSGKQFQLEYRIKPAGNNSFGNWTKVP